MKVVVCDKREIHLMDGPRHAGDVVDLPDRIALRYLERGAVERYETKVIREAPFVGAGEDQPSSALPAVRVLPQTTANPSGDGDKPKRRKRGA